MSPDSTQKRNHVPPPSSPGARGRATFDYSSHDGRFVIGQGRWSFETKWSNASDRSLHAYNDPEGIRGIAIARGKNQISEITKIDVEGMDFTSRTRTPSVGQILIIENTNGFMAAVKVISISVEQGSRPPAVEIEYEILTGGGSDFRAAQDDVFALYGSIEEMAIDLETQLTELWNETPGVRGGIGHNSLEFPMSQADFFATKAILDELSDADSLENLDRPWLTGVITALASTARAVGIWAAGKLDKAADEFFGEIGKTMADPKVIFGAWLAFSGNLEKLVDALSKLVL